jgi:positive regulator of sigma E activity
LDLAEFAQAYIHLKPYSASERQVQSLGRYAERVAIKTAKDIYVGDVVVEVEIEEGSLLTRVTVIGSILFGVYRGIANYKGFKERALSNCAMTGVNLQSMSADHSRRRPVFLKRKSTDSSGDSKR